MMALVVFILGLQIKLVEKETLKRVASLQSELVASQLGISKLTETHSVLFQKHHFVRYV
tara:strand:+ start:417 stop:593 length:177 start_codon:yes stop_codon:yes gene_type:complete